MKKVILMIMALALTATVEAAQNPCKGEKSSDIKLRMAETAGEGLFNANTFGLAVSSPSLWDAKEGKIQKNLQVITVEFRELKDDPNAKEQSFFYKSTIDLKLCKVIKTEVATGL